MQECISLLGHGDACQLLGELSPAAAWLPVLTERRVLDRGRDLPGEWIAKHIGDPAMIQSCAALDSFDDQVRWHVGRALETGQAGISPLQTRAWRLMLAAKRPTHDGSIDDSWFQTVSVIKRGQADFGTRKLISRTLRPRLAISKIISFQDDAADAAAPERLGDLLRLEFRSCRVSVCHGHPRSVGKEDRAGAGAFPNS